jgi:hypothetical protein
MSKEAYKQIRFTRSTKEMIEVLNSIAEDYSAQGFVLTVRQMYYQLVARDVVPNTMKSYKRVASIINDARLAGMIDWDVIEDRTRAFVRRQRWGSPQDILAAAANSYHEDMWGGQVTRPFVIIEKEALVGILDATCRKYDVPILAARGYPSSSVLREFALKDLLPAAQEFGQSLRVIHCGDHDPSGIDMTRDLAERLELFTGGVVEVDRVALNMKQVEQQKPPPNPAKQTDARFEGYRRKYGKSSWELDALSPKYLNSVVEKAIMKCVDDNKAWTAQQVHVTALREKIRNLGDTFKD